MRAWTAAWGWAEARPLASLIILCLALLLPGLSALPPLDRDEARFAQATKQMLETGDYVEIRFQDEARNKKPVGIYWLQAASVTTLSGRPYDQIWAYRVPSVLAAIFAVLMTYWAGYTLRGQGVAFMGAALFAASLLLIGEGHIAKTDATLLATVMAAQVALARAYLGEAGRNALGNALLFWIAIGVSILVKGPVGPMVAGLAAAALSLWDRDARWLLQLRPVLGVIVALAIALPWGIAIGIATEGRFFADALLSDFGGKLVEGQERHGGWPGYYLLLVSVTFWPAALFLLPAAVTAWSARAQNWAKFLIAWVVPAWIVFELVPTKLPHYVLPLYPALAIAAAVYLTQARATVAPVWRYVSLALFVLVGLALAVGLTVAPEIYGAGAAWWNWLLSALMIAAVAAMSYGVLKGAKMETGQGAVALGAAFAVVLLALVLPQLQQLTLSVRAAAMTHDLRADTGKPIGSAGYSEPSLVFLSGTRTRLKGARDLAGALARGEIAAAYIEKREQQAFLDEAAKLGLSLEEAGKLEGLNYSKGKPVTLTLYRARAS